MPGSNLLSSRWAIYAVMAVTLGSVSPAIAELFDFADPATRQGWLYWWFVGVPAATEALLSPAAAARDLVWATVFTLQYLGVFAVGAALVILLQQRRAPARRVAPRPDQQRAFDTAAAVYHLSDGWER